VAKTSLIMASDVRRALRFAREMRATSSDPVSLLLARWYERAWRDPVLSRAFLKHLKRDCAARRSPVVATWMSIKKTRALAPPDTPNHRFWAGPSAFSAAKGPWAWEPAALEELMRDILRHRVALDAHVYVAKLSALPYVSAYTSFAYLRTLQALGCVNLGNTEVAAATMSSCVAVLTQICPLPAWFKALRSQKLPDALPLSSGDVALVICETAKALQSLGFAVPKDGSFDSATFVQDFGSGSGRTLLACLRMCEPLSLEEIRAEDGIRSTEARLVDMHFPRTRAPWDRVPHVCRGSESLVVPYLRQQLQRRGYLMSDSVWKV